MATLQSSGYRRAIIVNRAEPGHVLAEMEDDFHHFRVALMHRGGIVESIAAQAVRHPRSLCPAAAAPLQELVGGAVATSLPEAMRRLPIREHCTHMYDLACLAVVYAASAVAARRWDIDVTDSLEGERRATLSIDRVPALASRIVKSDIVAPFAASLKGDFVRTAELRMSREAAEVAILLRRAVFVSGGRRADLDARANAADGARNLRACFVMQPEVAKLAPRVRGASRQFSDGMRPLKPIRPPQPAASRPA